MKEEITVTPKYTQWRIYISKGWRTMVTKPMTPEEALNLSPVITAVIGFD